VTAIPPTVTDVTRQWSLHLYVSRHILGHSAKAAEWNAMPFGIGRDTHVVPSNTVLDRDSSPPWEQEICGAEPRVHSSATYHLTTFVLVTGIRSK